MVAKNVLHKQRNLSKALKNMSSALKDNGFILIEEITSNFPVGFCIIKGIVSVSFRFGRIKNKVDKC
jgi:RecA/RadA recombinase